jgi:hypothetical protein
MKTFHTRQHVTAAGKTAFSSRKMASCKPLRHPSKSGAAFVKMLFLSPPGEFGQFRLLSAPINFLLHQKGFQIANSFDTTPGPAGQ